MIKDILHYTFHRENLEKFFIFLVFVFSLSLRLWKLDVVPAVINGDESESIISAVKIFLHKNAGPFELAHDLSVSYIAFYPKVIVLAVLGLEHSLLAVRLSTALMSLMSLVVFYLLLRLWAQRLTAGLMTLAFSCSYWFLNFSRLSWIAMDSVFWGLCLLLFTERMFKKNEKKYFFLNGLFSALTLYNYMGGRIYVVAVSLALFWWLIFQKEVRFPNKLKRIGLYFLVVFVLFLPQLSQILKHSQAYSLRARSLWVFGRQEEYYNLHPNNFFKILLHQIEYSVRGFLLFDPSVSAEGIENQRLIPPHRGAVDWLTVAFFWVGLCVSLTKGRKKTLWLTIYFLNILLLQIPSVFVPSWSRALPVLPIVYLFAGVGVEELCRKLCKRSTLGTIILSLIFICFSLKNVQIYWCWVVSDKFKSAQQPTITLDELERWQDAQITWMNAGKLPFTFYEWKNPLLFPQLDSSFE